MGEMIFSQVATHFENSQVKLVQSVLLIFVLIFVLIYTINKTKIRTIRVTNILLSFLVACLVGIISVFLGI
ncbi:sulfite exporter TauE/SafE family protein, partial [Streptococcus pyogenes]